MNIKPLKTKVALHQIDNEVKSSSGLVIMGGDKDTPEGMVIAIGPQVTDVVVGNRVLVDWAKATYVGNDVLIVEQEHITAVFE
jgi:co-chaperonin GroES (HSP10)